MHSTTLEQAYAHCRQVASSHYENFPVASFLLPKRLRTPVSVLYAFARQADDLADEGDLSSSQRLDGLASMQAALEQITTRPAAPTTSPLFMALAQIIEEYQLPLQPFHDLLTAFRMDVEYRQFENFEQSLDYCSYSANPVGLLLLHLFRAATAENITLSNALCSALQLINFYQDLAQDYHEHRRIYLPQDELQRFGVTEYHFRERVTDYAMKQLMTLQFSRARTLLQDGAPLGRRLPGRIGLELRMIIHGGLRVLNKLEQQHDLFSRPRLGIGDWLRVALHAFTR